MLKQNDKSTSIFLGTIIKVVLNYLRYSQMVWMIVFWAMFLFVFFLTMIFVVISSRPELLTNALNYLIRLFNIRDLHVDTVWGKEEILWAYGILSMVVYAIVALFKLIFNLKFTLNLKQKIVLFVGLIGCMTGLMFVFISLAYFFSHDSIYLGYYGLIVFFAICTLGTSLYYLLVSWVIDFVIKIIDYNLERNSVLK